MPPVVKERKIYKQGILVKQGGSTGNYHSSSRWGNVFSRTWKKRWFVFHSEGVSYYRSKEAYSKGDQEKGYVALDETFYLVETDEHDPLMFGFATETRVLNVKAPTMDVKAEWSAVLETVRKELPWVSKFSYSDADGCLVNESAGEAMPWTMDGEEAKGESGNSNQFNFSLAATVDDEEDHNPHLVSSDSLMEGYLSKIGGMVKTWKRRYFVLYPGMLQYHRLPQEKKHLGQVPLTPQTTLREREEKFTFEITHDGDDRAYIITASDQKNYNKWLMNIRKCSQVKTFIPNTKARTKYSPGSYLLVNKRTHSRSIKEGYLHKLGHNVQNWQRRYFVLLPDELFYQKAPHDKKTLNSIPLSAKTDVRPVDIPYAFMITTDTEHGKGKPYIVQGEDDNEREQWLQSLTRAANGKVKVTFPKRDKLDTKDSDQTLQFILRSEGKAAEEVRKHLLQFCKELYCDENFLFCVELQKFKRTQGEKEIRDHAEKIYRQFLHPDSETQVNTTSAFIKQLKMVFDGYVPKKKGGKALLVTPRKLASLTEGELLKKEEEKEKKQQESITTTNTQPTPTGLTSIMMNVQDDGKVVVDITVCDTESHMEPDVSMTPGFLNLSSLTESEIETSTNTPNAPEPSRVSSDLTEINSPNSPYSPNSLSLCGSEDANDLLLRLVTRDSGNIDKDFNSRKTSGVNVDTEAPSTPTQANKQSISTAPTTPSRTTSTQRNRKKNHALVVDNTMYDKIYKRVFGGLRDNVMPKYLLNVSQSQVSSWWSQILEEQEKTSTDVATPGHLLNLLTKQNLEAQNQIIFIRAYLVYFPAFSTRETLATHIIKKYGQETDISMDMSEQQMKSTLKNRLNVLDLLEEWIHKYWDEDFADEDSELVDLVVQNLEEWEVHNKPQLKEIEDMAPTFKVWEHMFNLFMLIQGRIVHLKRYIVAEQNRPSLPSESFEDEMDLQSIMRDEIDDSRRAFNSLNVPGVHMRAATNGTHLALLQTMPHTTPDLVGSNLYNNTVEKLAALLTVTDFAALKRIRVREFLKKNWTRKNKEQLSPNICAMINMYNYRSYWVATEVLRQEDAAGCLKAIQFFIRLVDQFVKRRNFFAVFAVCGGLSVQPVYRLKDIWTQLGKQEKKIFTQLNCGLLDTAKNSFKYREQFRKGLGGAQIPHLPILLKDLFNLEENIPSKNEDNGKINFVKYTKQYAQLQDFIQCTACPYHMHELSKAGVQPQEVCFFRLGGTQREDDMDMIISRLNPRLEASIISQLDEKNHYDEKELWQKTYVFQPRGTARK